MGMTKEGFFWGVMSVTFLGPGNGFPKMRGVFQKGGGILCFGNLRNIVQQCASDGTMKVMIDIYDESMVMINEKYEKCDDG